MRNQITPMRAAAGASILIAGIVIVGGVLWRTRSHAPDEVRSVTQTDAERRPIPGAGADSPAPGSASAPVADRVESIASAQPYPVNLDALRARLPNNRYWQLGVPTSDPAVAKLRAARAERDNVELGRILSGEASPDEVRAYYAERRAISRDYLQIAELVMTEQGEALPPRDRGMFELSANLHRARLQQIDRDESDALARRVAH